MTNAGKARLVFGLLGWLIAGRAQAQLVTPPHVKLTQPGGMSGDRLGFVVGLQGDVLVASATDDKLPVATARGRVQVFTRDAAKGTWSLPTKVEAPNGGMWDDEYGQALAFDGDVLAVSASSADFKGAIYVYERAAAGGFGPPVTVVGSGVAISVAGNFGHKIALHGNTLVATSGGGLQQPNVVYVFVRQGPGTWVEQAKLGPGPTARLLDFFAGPVALHGDTLLVGAPRDSERHREAGAVYVFTRTGATWAPTGKLFAPDPQPGDDFGQTLAIEGGVAVVGAPHDQTTAQLAGSVHVFLRQPDGTWLHQSRLEGRRGRPHTNFGSALALAGNRLVVGAPGEANDVFIRSGAAFLFLRNAAGEFVPQAHLAVPDGMQEDDFGTTMALSGDTLVLGAPRNLSQVGAVYAYNLQPGGGPIGTPAAPDAGPTPSVDAAAPGASADASAGSPTPRADAGAPGATPPPTPAPDAGSRDSAGDAGPSAPADDDGCGCHVGAPPRRESPAVALAALALVAAAVRRRARR